MTQKKIIRLRTPTMKKKAINIKYKPEMADGNIKKLLEIVAEKFVDKKKGTEAKSIRSLASRDIVHSGKAISADTKIGSLNFTPQMYNGEKIEMADLSFEESHTGGA